MSHHIHEYRVAQQQSLHKCGRLAHPVDYLGVMLIERGTTVFGTNTLLKCVFSQLFLGRTAPDQGVGQQQ
jgi:hypothetical protein